LGIVPTSCDDEVRLLPFDQALRAIVPIAEGDARANNIVDVRFEARRNPEVDHAGRDNMGVGGEEFRL